MFAFTYASACVRSMCMVGLLFCWFSVFVEMAVLVLAAHTHHSTLSYKTITKQKRSFKTLYFSSLCCILSNSRCVCLSNKNSVCRTSTFTNDNNKCCSFAALSSMGILCLEQTNWEWKRKTTRATNDDCMHRVRSPFYCSLDCAFWMPHFSVWMALSRIVSIKFACVFNNLYNLVLLMSINMRKIHTAFQSQLKQKRKTDN